VLLKLSDEEFVKFEMYLARLRTTRQQIQNLISQANELVDVINTYWEAAHMRAQLKDTEFKERLGDDSVPRMISGTGQLIVQIDAKARTARWETHHDAKRIAKESIFSGTIEEQLLEKLAELEQGQEVESGNYKCDKSTKEEE